MSDGCFKHRAAECVDLDGIEKTTIFHIGNIGIADPLKSKLKRILFLMASNLKSHVVYGTFTDDSTTGLATRFDFKVNDHAASAGTDFIAYQISRFRDSAAPTVFKKFCHRLHVTRSSMHICGMR